MNDQTNGPNMEPIVNRGAVKDYAEVVQQEQMPKQETTQANPGADYWRNQALLARQEAAELGQYRNIIKALEESPSLVDVLEKHISGEAANVAGSWENADEYWDSRDEHTDAKAEPATKGSAPADDGSRNATDGLDVKKREEINTFLGMLATQGVPDHAMDAFLQFMNNPSGVTIEDLWAVYNNIQKRTGAPGKVEAELPPPPVAAVPGATERPSQDTFKAPDTKGVVYVVDANNPL